MNKILKEMLWRIFFVDITFISVVLLLNLFDSEIFLSGVMFLTAGFLLIASQSVWFMLKWKNFVLNDGEVRDKNNLRVNNIFRKVVFIEVIGSIVMFILDFFSFNLSICTLIMILYFYISVALINISLIIIIVSFIKIIIKMFKKRK